MWGTCKIVNFSWLLFSTHVIGQNLLSVNAVYCVNGLHVGLCILCVKMRTFLCWKAPLPHNKRNCYPPYPDHYLMVFSGIAGITGFHEKDGENIHSENNCL